MTRRTPPSFDFFPDDFIGGTAHMTALEVGIYLRLLCFQWGQSFVPNDPQRIMRIAGISEQDFESSWPVIAPKFDICEGGNLCNAKLQDIREEQLARRNARVEAGRKGGSSKARNSLVAKRKQKRSKGKVEGGRLKDKKEVPEVPLPDSLSASDEFVKHWAAWLEYRSRTKPYKTPQGVKAQITKLEQIGPQRAVSAILHSIAGEYQGIYEPSGNGSNGTNGSNGSGHRGDTVSKEYQRREILRGEIIKRTGCRDEAELDRLVQEAMAK